VRFLLGGVLQKALQLYDLSAKDVVCFLFLGNGCFHGSSLGFLVFLFAAGILGVDSAVRSRRPDVLRQPLENAQHQSEQYHRSDDRPGIMPEIGAEADR